MYFLPNFILSKRYLRAQTQFLLIDFFQVVYYAVLSTALMNFILIHNHVIPDDYPIDKLDFAFFVVFSCHALLLRWLYRFITSTYEGIKNNSGNFKTFSPKAALYLVLCSVFVNSWVFLLELYDPLWYDYVLWNIFLFAFFSYGIIGLCCVLFSILFTKDRYTPEKSDIYDSFKTLVYLCVISHYFMATHQVLFTNTYASGYDFLIDAGFMFVYLFLCFVLFLAHKCLPKKCVKIKQVFGILREVLFWGFIGSVALGCTG